MNNFSKKTLASALLTMLVGASSSAQQVNNDALADYDQRKFGMFIHWGIYSVAGGEYQGKTIRGISEWLQHRLKIPVDDYAGLAKGFTASQYNAEDWAQLAKNAGMQYMVITAKHHDGFAMYDTKISDYNVVKQTPYAKDPMLALANAARRRDINFGFYYSQDQDWADPDARGNDWDYDADKRQPQRYVNAKALPQIDELLTGYGDLDLIWFDTPGLLSKQQASSLRDRVKQLQPQAVVNSRIGHGLGDFEQTGDNAIPLQVLANKKWEVPATINHSWGYKKDDNHWRKPKDLIAKLVDIVSKGGNYLLNIGPTGEGVVPEPSRKVLMDIGRWMKVNGQAIYATAACPFYYHNVNWRCTTKGNKLYLHLLRQTTDTFQLQGLNSQVKAARLLGVGKVSYQQSGQHLEIKLPKAGLYDHVDVIELTLAEQEVQVAANEHRTIRPDKIDLFAWSARFRGPEMLFDWQSNSVSNFVDITKAGFARQSANFESELWWYPYGSISGKYQVSITYACQGQDTAGTAEFHTKFANWTVDTAVNQSLACNSADQMQTVSFESPVDIELDHEQLVFRFKDFGKNLTSFKLYKVTLTKLKR